MPLRFPRVMLVVVLAAAGCSKRPPADEGSGSSSGNSGGSGRSAAATEADALAPAGTFFEQPAWETRAAPALTPAQAREADPEGYRVSPTGRRWACVLKQFGGKTLVVDGVVEKQTFDRIADVYFNADDGGFAYTGARTVPNSEVRTVVVVGKPLTPDPANHPLSEWRYDSVFASSDTGTAYRWARAEDGQVVVDGKPVFKTPKAGVSQLQFSRDGSAVGFVVTEGQGTPQQEMYPVVNGEPQKRFRLVQNLALSDDGRHWGCYATADTGKAYWVIDGRPTAATGGGLPPQTARGQRVPYEHLRLAAANRLPAAAGEPGLRAWSLSPDGKHLAHTIVETADDGTQFLRQVIDDKPHGRWAEVSAAAWSADGRRWAFLGREKAAGPWVVVSNGERSAAVAGEPKLDSLCVAPAGTAVGFLVERDLTWFPVVNGKPAKGFDKIGVGGSRVGFTPDGQFTFLARAADGGVAWVRVVPPGSPKDASPAAPVEGPKDGWVKLFDGKDASRWFDAYQKERRTPAVEGGAILVANKPGFGACFRTQGADFKDFHLRLEARIENPDHGRGAVGFRGGYVLVNDRSRFGYTGTFFPVYLDQAVEDTRPDPTVNNAVTKGLEKPVARSGEWNTLELLVEGKRFQVRVNGTPVGTHELSDGRYTHGAKGPIVLYCDMGQVRFRNIEIRDGVDPKAWGAK